MKTPHKHAAVIKAWADGAEIEFLDTLSREPIWRAASRPSWTLDTEYRIKPELKTDRVYYGVFDKEDVQVKRTEIGSCFTKYNDSFDQIKVTFDGETGKLKSAEVL
jgi:lysyl-tRNA synthetase class II